MNRKGKFITFEGADGAGKSTQIRLTSEYLTSRGIPHIVTREPGGTPLAEKLRELLLWQRMPPDVELMLMFTARADHVQTLIKPKLEEGVWVLSDRFVDSSYAYQGGGGEYPIDRIMKLHQWVLGDFAPDLTLVFDVEVSEAHRRMESGVAGGERIKLDKFELKGPSYFDRVRMTMQDMIEWPENFKRMRLIDATQAVVEVQRDIQAHLKPMMVCDGDSCMTKVSAPKAVEEPKT